MWYYCSLLVCLLLSAEVKASSFKNFLDEFNTGYSALHMPEFGFDYKEYFNGVPDTAALNNQEDFFKKVREQLRSFPSDKLNTSERQYYTHIQYETDYNLKRIALEKDWVTDGRKVPAHSLYSLPNRQNWYKFFVKKYTSTDITPEDVYAMGLRETKRVQNEIKRIQLQLGFADSAAFYKHLKDDSSYLHDKNMILSIYASIDKKVRQNLDKLIPQMQLPDVAVIEWPNASAYTPPGAYINRVDNAYGKDVFQFNFFNQTHNKRSMEWLYMHEAIPGHHLQFTFRQQLKNDHPFRHHFYYPGNFEGWACYVEYYGKDVGLYTDPYMELGKWEWDLVRSVRLVLDVGVHYYGWSREQAMAFWKQNIPGQDEIADREITRITNWPAQALSYKVGADAIEGMKRNFLKANPKLTIRDFHQQYLRLGYFPLEVVQKCFESSLPNKLPNKE